MLACLLGDTLRSQVLAFTAVIQTTLSRDTHTPFPGKYCLENTKDPVQTPDQIMAKETYLWL